MSLVVVVDELGDGLVVAAGEHAGGCGLGLDCLLVSSSTGADISLRALLTLLFVDGLVLSVGTVRALVSISDLDASHMFRATTHHHLLQLVAHGASGDLLEVLQAREDLVLHLELHLHAELGTLLDGKGLALELFNGAGRPEVDDDVGAAFDLEAERLDDAFARVIGVGQRLAGA